MPWKWYDSQLIKVENETPTTKRFWLEVLEETVLDFKAGQFVTMDLPIAQKRLQRWRSYSIANAPEASNVLEFAIVRLDGGAATKYLFDEVQIGDIIRFKGPSGTFTLPDEVKHDLVFVCTGTGVAPFRSMIWDLYNRQIPTQKIHLIFGTRTEDGILYRTEFDQLEMKWPVFSYDIALSRETNWPGFQGYVHQIYQQKYATPREDVLFYLCGWSNMIDEAVANLVNMGYDKSQIHYELYG